jgi:hypothetical protein
MSDSYNHEGYTGEEERDEHEFVNEEDVEVYGEALEQLGSLGEAAPFTLGEPYASEPYADEVGVPENLLEDDLSDDTTEYSEAEFHDETRIAEHVVEDLDLGEALYYEKDLDYQHMDGKGFEDELENLEEVIDFGDDGEGAVSLHDEDEVAERNPGPGAEQHDAKTFGG